LSLFEQVKYFLLFRPPNLQFLLELDDSKDLADEENYDPGDGLDFLD
jgi:hypothetical protein